MEIFASVKLLGFTMMALVKLVLAVITVAELAREDCLLSA
jgi:hypothetical protein